MASSFSSMTYRDLILTTSRMDLKTRCRLRQTCKWVNQLILENESKADSPLPWTLCLFLKTDRTPRIALQLFKGYIGWRRFYERCFHSEGMDKIMPILETIADPLGVQGFNFDQICIVAPDNVEMEVEEDPLGMTFGFIETDSEEYDILQFFPLLEQLKQKCDRLSLIDEGHRFGHEDNLRQILPLIQFNRINTTDNWNNEPVNCIEHYMNLDNLFDALAPQIKHLEHATLAFFRFQPEVLPVVEHFLMGVQNSRSCRGNLKSVVINTVGQEQEENLHLAGIEVLWKGVVQAQGRFTFFKLYVPDGVALIINEKFGWKIFFRGTDDRQTLVDTLADFMLPKRPIDISAAFEEFVKAENDEVAFTKLYDLIQ